MVDNLTLSQEDADKLFSDESLSQEVQTTGDLTQEQADQLFSDLEPPQTSTAGTYIRGVERGVIPMAAAVPMIGFGQAGGEIVGSAIGGAIGSVVAPGAGTAAGAAIGATIGGFVGGIGGGFAGGVAGAEIQDFAVSKLPDSVKKKIGWDEQQQLVDEQQHPYAAQLGGLTPFLLTARPFAAPGATAAKADTALGRFMQDWRTQKAAGGVLMGGWELGQEALNGDIDWTKVGIASAFGAIFNHQNKAGQRLMAAGEAPFNPRLNQIRALRNEAADEAGRVRSVDPGLLSERRMDAGIFYKREINSDLFDPTLREVSISGILGPGNTEKTFLGLQERNPVADSVSRMLMEDEQAMLYGPQVPDETHIATTARKIDPELFDYRDELLAMADEARTSIEGYRKPSMEEYNGLRSQRDELDAELAGTKNKDEQRRIRTQIRFLQNEIDGVWSRMSGEGQLDETLTRHHNDLASINAELRRIGPEVAATNRRAAEALGRGDFIMEITPFEPEAALAGQAGVAPDLFVEAQGEKAGTAAKPSMTEAMARSAGINVQAEKAKIADDVRRQYIEAGRTEEEAAAAAALISNRYVTRAATFQGGQGTPFEMYLAKHARVTEWNPKTPPSAPPVAPVAPPPEAAGGSSAAATMKAAEAKLAETTTSAPVEPGTLPEAPAAEPTFAQETGSGSVDFATEAPAAPVEPIGPKVGDTLTMSGVKYKIAALDDKSVRLTPTRKKDNAAAISLPRAALDQMLGEHVAPTAQAAGEKIMLNGEALDPKLAEIVRAKLAEQKEVPQEATAGRAPDTADEASLRAKLRQESMQSDEVFYQSKEADKSRFDELAKQKKEAEARGEEPPPPPDDLQPTEVYSPLDDAAFGLKATDVENDVSLLAYLDSVGGLAPDSELAALFDKNVPRYSYKTTGGGYEKVDAKTGKTVKRGTHSTRSLIREGGLTLDQALENAVREGYLTEEGDLTGGNAKLSPNDLLDKIRQEANGTKVFRQSAGEGDLKARMREGEQFLAGVKKAKTAIVKEAKLDRAIKRVLESDAGDRVLTLASDIIAKEPGAWTPKEAINEALGQYERELQRKFDENPEIREARINKYGQTPDWDASYVKYGEVGWFDTLSGEWASAEKASELDARAAQIHSGKSSEAGGGATGEGGLSSRTSEAGGRSGEPSGGGQAGDGTEYFQRTGKGKAERALGKYVKYATERLNEIWLKPEANPSTIIHENGHDFLEQLKDDAGHEAAPNQLRADYDTVKNWLGWKEGQKDFTTKQHEKFARGFERYFFDGIAPNKELAAVFERFSNWLRDAYKTVLGLNKPEAIPEEIRAVFDRMLASEPYRVTLAREADRPSSFADTHVVDAAKADMTQAAPMADRVEAERTRVIAELPKEIRNELTAAAERNGVGESATGLGAGNSGMGIVEANSGGRSTVTTSGARRADDGALGASGRNAAEESAGTSRGDDTGMVPTGAATLGRDAGATDGRFVDRAGNIRLENLTNREDLRAAIREIAYGNDGFIDARRGVISDIEGLSLAEQIGFDGAEQLVADWVRGQAFNHEEILALRLLIKESTNDLWNKAKAVQDGGDWQAVRDYSLARERHIAIQRTLSGATAEWGRAGRAFRDISGDAKIKTVEKMLRQNTGSTLFQLREEADLLSKLDNEAAVNRFARDMERPGFFRGIQDYWINGLISGPTTHSTYVIANEMLALWRAIPETLTRAAIAEMAQAMGRETPAGERVRFGEAWRQILGATQGFAPALKAAAGSLKTGVTTLLPGETMRTLPGVQPGQEAVKPAPLDAAYTLRQVVPDLFAHLRASRETLIAYAGTLKNGVNGESGFGLSYSPIRRAIPDVTYNGVRIAPIGTMAYAPGRAIQGIHAFHRVQFYFMELNAEAFRKASAELEAGQILPEQFETRIAQLKNNPDRDMVTRASEAATEGTMMKQGGELTRRVAGLMNYTTSSGLQPLKFIDPFVHITSNVIESAIIARTPVGLLSSELRADIGGKNGAMAQDKAIARMALGTAVMTAVAGAVMEGVMTGGEPSDPAEAAIWKKTHQAYSVKLGDTWYSYHRLGVVGLLMGVSADLIDVGKHAAEEKYTEAVSSLAEAFYHNIFEESFLRGPAEMFRAIENHERYGPQWIKNFGSSFMPYSVGMSQIARTVDPYSRRAYTFAEALKQKVPYASMDLLPRRDLWGEPVRNQQPTFAGGVVPTAIYQFQPSTDMVDVEMDRLGVKKSQVERKIRNVELDENQYDDFQRIAGRMAKMQLDGFIKSERYQSYPDDIKRMEIDKIFDHQREAARNLMMMKYKQIPRDAYKARISGLAR